MATDSSDEDGQFEQVLTRLDALIQRNYSPSLPDRPLMKFTLENVEPEPAVPESFSAETADSEIPVLTEVFQRTDHTVPTLTETAPVAEAPDESGRLSRAEEADFVLEELMPGLRKMIQLIVQQELADAQQKLSQRICLEAEQVLRLRLLEPPTPK